MSLTAMLVQTIGTLGATRKDSAWYNMLTGRGTDRDKITHARFDSVRRLDDEQIRALYYGSSIAARVVDEVVLETKRAGFEISGVSDDSKAKILVADTKLKGIATLYKCAARARAFGGGLAVCSVIGAGDPTEPMHEGARVESVRITDRRRAYPVAWYDDPSEPYFGEPAIYQVTQTTPRNTQTFNVHASKCIRFDGIEVDEEEGLSLNGWSYSVLQRVYDNLKKYDSSTDSIAALLEEASVGVYKIKDLAKIITSPKRDELMARMQIVDMVKSTIRSLMLDEDETYERVAANFSGLDSASDRLAQRLASAAGMPLTILLGMSPAGMNATGESDRAVWYSQVGRWRQESFHDRVVSYLRLIGAQEGVPLEELDAMKVEFGNLWTPTAKESAELYSATATADRAYFDMGLDFERIALARFASGRFAPDAVPVIDIESMQAALTATEVFNPNVKSFELTPSALEGIVTVEKALANIGLPSLPALPDGSRNPDNDLPVEAYRAKMSAQQEATGTAIGEAEGAATAADVPGVPVTEPAPSVETTTTDVP